MSEGEQPTVYHPEPQSNVGKWILIVLAVAFAGASSYFTYDHHGKLEKMTQDAAASQKQIGDLTKRMQAAEADTETLGEKLGMTKKELATPSRRVAAPATGGRRRAARPRRRNRRKTSAPLPEKSAA